MKRNISAAVMAALLLALTACGGAGMSVKPVYQSAEFMAMDTFMDFRVYGSNPGEALYALEEKTLALDSLLSVTDEKSEVYIINSSAGDPVHVSPDTLELARQSLELCRRAEGNLDVTIYPLVKAWGFTGGAYRVPGEDELSELLELVDFASAGLDYEAGTIALPEGGMLDFGSVAKGYAGDVMAEIVREHGAGPALLSLGGNIQAVGSKPDGSPWNVAVQNPGGDGYLGIVEVVDKAVVTSGGYERYFEEDGETWWHILDPGTGRPAKSGLISVTVIGESGILCDGLSTALFVMGLEGAMEHYRQYGDFEAILVTENNEVCITGGIEGAFRLLDENYTLKTMPGGEQR